MIDQQTKKTTNRSSRVYVINDGGHDFSDAERFGEVLMITSGSINIFSPERDRLKMVDVIKNFDPKKDFICLAGGAFTGFLAGQIFEYLHNVEHVRLLIFNSKSREYFVRDIKFVEKIAERKRRERD